MLRYLSALIFIASKLILLHKKDAQTMKYGCTDPYCMHYRSLVVCDLACKQSDNPCFDEQYKRVVERGLAEIIDICEASKGGYSPVAEDEIENALKSLNMGKAADIFGLTAEHLVCASNELIPMLTALLNCIFHVGELSYSLKLGLLTPIFKKKGFNIDAKNYRGITILPIF